MDTVKSFRGYGKVDPAEEQAFRKKTRKRIIILVVSLLLLAALIVGAVVGTVAHRRGRSKSGDDGKLPAGGSSAQSIKAMCSVTQNPEACAAAISAVDGANATADPAKLFQMSLVLVRDSLEKLGALPEIWINQTGDLQLKSALEVCDSVFDDAVESTNDSIALFTDVGAPNPLSKAGIGNLKTWLSTSLTDLETCLDALREVNATALESEVNAAMKNSTQFASNSLAIVAKFLSLLDKFNGRKLLSSDTDVIDSSGLPTWLGAAERRLLQEGAPPVKPDVTVAADGSGDFKSIVAALARVPKKSKTRFVIYVKEGVYKEQVTLDKSMWNVMMYGDGKTKSIVRYHSNNVAGVRTMLTATFTAAGRGFIAKNMGFENDAGAINHQAVAMRSASDQSVFYLCSFTAFQDTLYAHNNRQFYKECDVTGTVDFIFGNAAVVFQNCNIMPRQPLPNQFVTITAQGKIDPNMNTGITIQNCKIFPLDTVTLKVYLGRPWKAYSTAVIMESEIDAIIQPQGWIEWQPNVPPPTTIFYAENLNTGAGADVSKRVTWPGYKSSLTPPQAAKFTVGEFLDGNAWITAAEVRYT